MLSFGLSLQFWPMSAAAVQDFHRLIRQAEEFGIEALGTSDTSFVMGDAAARLTLVALGSEHARVGLQPTNPLTREPQVMASLLASVDCLTGGRAFMNIGSGDSSVLNIGLRPASRSTITDYVGCIRALLESGHGSYKGRPQRIQWMHDAVRPRIPIGVLAEGPKMLALAGQIGDCSVIGTGLTPEVVRDSVKRVAAAASLASRDPSELEVWFTARAALNTSREVAVEQVKGPVASILNHSMRFGLENKDVPEELQGRVQSYVDNYDLADHAGGNNVQLMNELSLTPWALDRWAIVGTPDDWIERLQAIELAGVTRLWFTIGRGLEVQRRSLELLGREVIPFLR